MIHRTGYHIIFYSALLQTIALPTVCEAEPIPVSIDANIIHQTIDGFGASDCWSFQKIGEWDLDNKNQVADLLFSPSEGIGLSQWRFNIGAGINPQTIHNSWRTVETFEIGPGEYDWSRQAEERWFLDAAKNRGVDQFIAFVNSPPARITRNGLTNCTDGVGSTNLKNGWENQFARYLKDILVHFRDEWDLEFDYISPVNEPQWEWNNGSNQEGNRASNADIRSIALALYDSLQLAGLNTEISLVESGDLRSWYQYNSSMNSEYGEAYGNYLDEIIDNPELSGKISKHIGSHSYWSDRINTQLVQDREALATQLAPYISDGWDYWMTEYTILDGPNGEGGNGRDLGMTLAINVARVMHYDLTILNASSWQWWTAMSPENYQDGLLYTDYKTNSSDQSIIESKLLWTFGNFSRFIRPGYRRIEMSGADNKFGLMGSAYLSADTTELVIVLLNAASNDKEINLEIEGLEIPDGFRGFLTSDVQDDDLRDIGEFSLNEPIEVPPHSALTLVSTTQVPDPPFEGYDPNLYQLYQNYPNPFNSGTNLCFNLPTAGPAELTIYTLRGEMIHSVAWSDKAEGIQNYTWDGHSQAQKTLTSGIYFYTLKAGNEFQTRKMMFIQ